MKQPKADGLIWSDGPRRIGHDLFSDLKLRDSRFFEQTEMSRDLEESRTWRPFGKSRVARIAAKEDSLWAGYANKR